MSEDRRKRYSRGVQLTPELQNWIMQAVNAQRTGQAVPPPPTRMTGVRVPGDADYVTPVGDEQPTANQGQLEYAPAYVDPRSESIAATPALVRPVASMLDKVFRPGRADVVNEMNREYLQGLPAQTAAQQKLTSDTLLEELRSRALAGDKDAADAMKRLSAFRTADRPAVSGGDKKPYELLNEYLRSDGEDGLVGRDPESGYGIKKKSGQQPAEDSEPLVPEEPVRPAEPVRPRGRGPITGTDAWETRRRDNTVNRLQKEIDDLTAAIEAKKAGKARAKSPGGRGMRSVSLETLEENLQEKQKELDNLQQPLTNVSIPTVSGIV